MRGNSRKDHIRFAFSALHRHLAEKNGSIHVLCLEEAPAEAGA